MMMMMMRGRSWDLDEVDEKMGAQDDTGWVGGEAGGAEGDGRSTVV
jgi:hypothetical protein